VERIRWLRAAVLSANDGILSTASLIVGVAAAAATKNAVLVAGVAGLVAGAMSMATGEYVSVSSQSDTERADLARERKELSDNVESEPQIYIKRGLEPALARQVAQQLMAKDALTAHARDELGISEITTAPRAGRTDFGSDIFGRRGITYGRRISHRCNCPDSGCGLRKPREKKHNNNMKPTAVAYIAKRGCDTVQVCCCFPH
jgi:VIT1/CCC1 family predicted Fe2+/Mn2+ transporter